MQAVSQGSATPDSTNQPQSQFVQSVATELAVVGGGAAWAVEAAALANLRSRAIEVQLVCLFA